MTDRYNRYAKQWIDHGLGLFNQTSFSIVVDSESQPFTDIHETEGYYYPFRDKCNQKGDPICVSTPSFYYETTIIPDKSSLSYSIYDASGHPVLLDILVLNRSKVVSSTDLHCSST